MMIRKASDL